MGNTLGGISMVSNIASSLISGMARRRAIKKENAVNLANWERAYMELRVQLGVAHSRTEQQILDIDKNKVRTQMGARVAARKVQGTRAVKAAQMNIQGRRASRDIYVPVSRAAANEISDAEINAEVQSRNVVNHFNDTARAAINNLNTQAPLAKEVPSTMSMLVTAGNTALDTYTGMSEAQQSDFKGMFPKFNTKSVDITKLSNTPQIQLNKVSDYGGYA